MSEYKYYEFRALEEGLRMLDTAIAERRKQWQ